MLSSTETSDQAADQAMSSIAAEVASAFRVDGAMLSEDSKHSGKPATKKSKGTPRKAASNVGSRVSKGKPSYL